MAKNTQTRPESEAVEQPELTTAKPKESAPKTETKTPEAKEKKTARLVPRRAETLPGSVRSCKVLKAHQKTGKVLVREIDKESVAVTNLNDATVEVSY